MDYKTDLIHQVKELSNNFGTLACTEKENKER